MKETITSIVGGYAGGDWMLFLRDLKNNGRTHLFLGDPCCEDVDKTTVEPGCAFSPGLWTFGISVAVSCGDETVAPQNTDLPLQFENGFPPIVESRYWVGDATVHSAITNIESVDYFSCSIDRPVAEAAVIISDFGPAGGRIDAISYDERRKALTVSRKHGISMKVELRFETPVDVHIYPADDSHESAFAVLNFARETRFAVIHTVFFTSMLSALLTPSVRNIVSAFAESRRRFHDAVPAGVFAPDPRIAATWAQCSFHILNAMETNLPRIGVANYPILWMRDCVIVLRALDAIGRSDLAQPGCDAVAEMMFSGGFGCEADNPGEGIWILVNHYLMTRDDAWLKQVYPFIQRKADMIDRMMHTKTPMQQAGNNRSVSASSIPGFSLICAPSIGEHIHGRMDGHFPDFYINCWAYAGLDMAHRAAQALSRADDEALYREKAERLKAEIASVLLPEYGNDRDGCVTPYPTGALANSEDLAEALNNWYVENRLTEIGQRKPERLWTYFEVAQMHNMMLIGRKDRMWINLDGMLDEARCMNMSLFGESDWGRTEMLPFGNGSDRRGWLQQNAYAGNMPHNWTTGEMILLLKDMFVEETDDGLVLLRGVPKSWNKPGVSYGVRHMPTRFGKVSFTVEFDREGKRGIFFQEGQNIPWHLAPEEH